MLVVVGGRHCATGHGRVTLGEGQWYSVADAVAVVVVVRRLKLEVVRELSMVSEDGEVGSREDLRERRGVSVASVELPQVVMAIGSAGMGDTLW